MAQYFGEPIFGDAVFGANGEEHVRQITSSIGTSDSTERAVDAARDHSDVVGLRDVADRKADSARDHADALRLADEPSQSSSSARVVTDASRISDLADRSLSAARVLSDGIGLLDGYSLEQTYVSVLSDLLGLNDSTSTAQTFRLAITDAVGVVDATERQVNATRFSTDPINGTDQADTAITYVTFIQESVNGADPPIDRVASTARAHVDSTGSTDSSLGAESYFRDHAEPIGLLDAVLVQLSYPRVVTDRVGAQDLTQRQVDALRAHPDGMVINEPVSTIGRRFDRQPGDAPESVGLTDTTVYFLRNDGVPQDLLLLEDSLTQAASASQSQTDPLGVLDGVRVEQSTNSQPVSVERLTDTAATSLEVARSASDAVGLTDTPERAIAHIRELTSSVGVSDEAAPAAAYAPFFFDRVSGSDAHGQGLTAHQALVEPMGLPDGVATSRRVVLADFSSVLDGDPVQLLSAPRTLTDPLGVQDAVVELGRDHQRTITDSAGLTEQLAPDFQRDGRLHETTGITDSLQVALTRELTESVAVLEPGFGPTTVYEFVITEPMLVREEVYRTPQGPDTSTITEQQIFGAAIFGDPVFGTGLQREVPERVGVTDPLTRLVSTRRVHADAEQVTDTTTQAVAHVRVLTDDIGTVDAYGLAAQRRLQDSTGSTDAVDYLNARIETPVDVQHTRDTAAQVHSANRRQHDSAGLTDVLQPAATLRRTVTDAVGTTDAAGITRQYEIGDQVGVTDPAQQRFTHARIQVDSAGVADVVENLFGARPLFTEPVGVRDSLNVDLVPPGLVRYGHLRPVFPGKPYIWSIQARRIGNHISRAGLEVRWHNQNLQEFARDAPEAIDIDSLEPRRIDIRVQAPKGAFYASLYFGHVDSVDGDQIDWDSAQWEQGEVPTAYGPKPDEVLPGSIQNTMLALGAVSTDRVKAGAITNSLVAVGAIDARTLATNAVDNRVLAPGSVNTEQLVVGSIVTGAIAAGAIVADKIAANAIVAGKIAADAIGAREIIANSITAKEIAANSLTANEIAAGAITASELAANAVYAGAIQANAISGDKITANTIQGSHIQAGSVHADRLQAHTISANQIAAGAIVAQTIAAGAIIAEKIAAGQIVADKIAASAVTTEKLAALAVKADQVDSNAIRAHHIQADAVQAIHILAGSITADELSATAITGKIITGGVLQTGVQGEDRIVISAVDGRDQYGRNYRDVIQWRNPSNQITGEIRGFLGDIGIYGIQLNSHVQLGHRHSVIYQLGQRSVTNSKTQVRMGSATAVCDGNGNWTANFPGLPTTPTSVVVTAGDDAGTHLFVGFAVQSWTASSVRGRMRYLVIPATGQPSVANPGSGTQFAIRYYAECAA